jgi:tetratricopeptide (TPR) repeat protein
MSQRKIFLSCVNRELKSYRLKAEVLIQERGYRPIFEEMFPLDDQTALATLKSRIAECDAVICLVGHAYGGELRNLPPNQPQRSFTQWEYFLAQDLPTKPPIFRLATTPETPTDDQTAQPPPDPEPQELRDLQAEFRRLVLDDHNFRTFANVDQLEKELALLRFPWEPGNGTRKPFLLPFGSIGSLFKGREDVLTDLHHRLQTTASHTVAVTQVLHGLGGVGKTRLAIEYAHRFANDYCAVLFASADTPSNLESNLARLVAADALDLREKEEGTKPAEQAAAVLRWLKENSGWLLILDNVDTDEARQEIQTLLKPGLGAGAVLVTGRNAHYANHISVLPLGVLDTPAATEYLLQATEGERQISPTDPADAEALAVAMGGLSLALEQAAAFISAKSIGFAEYLARWREGEEKVRAYYDPDKMQYPRSMLVTWDTTFAQLDPAARRLLNILSWFAPEPIPRGVLETKEAKQFFAELLTGQTESGQAHVAPSPTADLEDALATLKKYALIRWDDTRTHFSVHRLVQEVTRQRQSTEEQQAMVWCAALILNAFLPDDPPPDDVRSWQKWRPAAPHVNAVVWAVDAHGITQPTSRLMNEFGLFQKAIARFAIAEALHRRALTIDEQNDGPDHPNVAISLNNLARVLHVTNRLLEAEPLIRRALAIDAQCFGPDHPNVAMRLNNLALLLMDTNRLAEAEPLMRRALAIDEQSFGPNHPNVALKLNNLAQLLKATNRRAEAESLMRRALAIDEQSFGPNHPNVALKLNNLAQSRIAANCHAEGELLLRRALAIFENSYGPNHPIVATNLNNLAQSLKATNRLTEAESLMHRALAIDEKSLGPNHSDVAINLNNLAVLLQDTNRLAEAEPLLRRALTIEEQSLGPDHPNVAIKLNNLAHSLRATNRLHEAEPLMRRMVLILLRFTVGTGHKHPHLREGVGNFLSLSSQLGRSDKQIGSDLVAMCKEANLPFEELRKLLSDTNS